MWSFIIFVIPLSSSVYFPAVFFVPFLRCVLMKNINLALMFFQQFVGAMIRAAGRFMKNLQPHLHPTASVQILLHAQLSNIKSNQQQQPQIQVNYQELLQSLYHFWFSCQTQFLHMLACYIYYEKSRPIRINTFLSPQIKFCRFMFVYRYICVFLHAFH